jgi:hypothetical protein
MTIAHVSTGSWVEKMDGVDTDAEASYTFGSVASNDLLTLTVTAFRYGENTTDDIVQAVRSNSGATAWHCTKREQYVKDGSFHKTELTEWCLPGAPSGTVVAVLDFLGSSTTIWKMQGSRYSGAGTTVATAVATPVSNEGDPGEGSASTGSSGTLAQADVLVRASMACAYAWSIDPPVSGWTERGESPSGGNFLGCSILDSMPGATTAKSATWTKNVDANDQGWVALLTQYKGATVNKRIEITSVDTAINGTTGWTVYWWQTDPASGLVSGVYKKAGITAEASGGKIYVVDSNVPNLTDGTNINCFAYRPGGSPVKGLTGIVVGTVKDYS